MTRSLEKRATPPHCTLEAISVCARVGVGGHVFDSALLYQQLDFFRASNRVAENTVICLQRDYMY